jgi:ubiquinone/menaquinone biosynthesis C-methylase UbiE
VTSAPGRYDEPATVVDLAAGYADQDRNLAERSHRNGAPWRLIAVDFQRPTLRLARAATPTDLPVWFVQADARRLPFRPGSVDYAFSSLALHHFSDDDAVGVLAEMRRVARRGAVCIDLVRGRLATFCIWLLTALIFRDPMTRVDARTSVRRAFTHDELLDFARRAGWGAVVQTKFFWFQQSVRARFRR